MEPTHTHRPGQPPDTGGAHARGAAPHGPEHVDAAERATPGPARPAAGGPEDGSLVTEYGLLAILAATIAAAVIEWASDGAMATLFNAVMRSARDIVGA